MLGRSRGGAAEPGAPYAALWTHLQRRYPRLRTILITAASNRDDAAGAARELAHAAARLPTLAGVDRNSLFPNLPGDDGLPPEAEFEDLTPGSAGVEAAADAFRFSDANQIAPHAVTESAGSVQIIDAVPSAQDITTLSRAGADFALTIVVAPPPQHSSECIALASAADATILVATRGRTRSREARQAANLLRLADVEIAAALLLREGGSRRRTATAADGAVTHLRTPIPASHGPSTAVGDRPRAAS